MAFYNIAASIHNLYKLEPTSSPLHFTSYVNFSSRTFYLPVHTAGSSSPGAYAEWGPPAWVTSSFLLPRGANPRTLPRILDHDPFSSPITFLLKRKGGYIYKHIYDTIIVIGMVKRIFIALEDSDFETLKTLKQKMTWEEFLVRPHLDKKVI